MSSNNPYGGPQQPMPGQGPGSGPGQPLSPYGYPQQPPPGGPPTGSGYSFGPFAPDEQTTEWQGSTQPGPYGSPPSSYDAGPVQPAPQPKGKGKILIIIGAAALAVILMAVLAVIVATRSGPARQSRRHHEHPGTDQSVPEHRSTAGVAAFGCGGGLPASSCCRRRSCCLVLCRRSSAHGSFADQ